MRIFSLRDPWPGVYIPEHVLSRQKYWSKKIPFLSRRQQVIHGLSTLALLVGVSILVYWLVNPHDMLAAPAGSENWTAKTEAQLTGTDAEWFRQQRRHFEAVELLLFGNVTVLVVVFLFVVVPDLGDRREVAKFYAPYSTGLPGDRWPASLMGAQRASAYLLAGITAQEARSMEFDGGASGPPSTEALELMAALNASAI